MRISRKVKKYEAKIFVRRVMLEGVDYTGTYSPTVRFESIPMMLAWVAHGANG